MSTTTTTANPAGLGNVIVLKLGGSVLAKTESLPLAVHEIYRWLREGHRVVAVVSALGGQTDRLLATARAVPRDGQDPDAWATAALLATGESHSAPLLALHLHNAGVPAEVVDTDALALTAAPPAAAAPQAAPLNPLDADPTSANLQPLLAALARASVVIVPGFLAREQGPSARRVLLGRGGSDLTALFLGRQLAEALPNANVAVRLVKDVPGLFERDPNAPGLPPRRYQGITFADALALDGRIVQHKAVRFAQSAGLPFQVAGLNAAESVCTTVGAPATAIVPQDLSDLTARPLRVGLLGLGTVGRGVLEAVTRDPSRLSLAGVAVRNPRKAVASGIPAHHLRADPWELLDGDADVIVEATGAVAPALALIEEALAAGKHVVTANKQLLARHGPHLRALAAKHGVRILASAAVGGATPILETLTAIAAAGHRVTAVRGVVNGTCNFILDRLAAGDNPADAVNQAKLLGYAEPDPTADLSGEDAACKLVVIAAQAFSATVPLSAVNTTGIAGITTQAAQSAARTGQVYRLIASATLGAEGQPVLTVAPALLPTDHPLAQVKGEHNGVEITFTSARGTSSTPSTVLVTGRGAGRWPTTEAILGDLLELARTLPVLTQSDASVPSARPTAQSSTKHATLRPRTKSAEIAKVS